MIENFGGIWPCAEISKTLLPVFVYPLFIQLLNTVMMKMQIHHFVGIVKYPALRQKNNQVFRQFHE
jgi:hypothetical protein